MNARIVMDPKIWHSKPVIRGTRTPVAILVGSLAGGMTFEEMLAEDREEVRQKGREEGQRELLATLLQERFGRLSKLGRDLLKAQSLHDLGLEE